MWVNMVLLPEDQHHQLHCSVNLKLQKKFCIATGVAQNIVLQKIVCLYVNFANKVI
jgi:hypothetical protein